MSNRVDLEPGNGAAGRRRFFGKYRGTVVNNIDPLNQGRIMALVPGVSNTPTTWAMACLPVAGWQMGFFSVPPIGAGVWIEFENGDPDYPIWAGCWHGSAAEVPVMALSVPPGVPGLTLQTPGQNGITISDLPGPTGGIVIKTRLGATVTVNDTGIIIQNGRGASISMIGPTVNINNGALVVT